MQRWIEHEQMLAAIDALEKRFRNETNATRRDSLGAREEVTPNLVHRARGARVRV
jgi:hypothetical protein